MEYPSWLNRQEYPFSANYLNFDGHHMHYLDEGSGNPVLFVHGTPSWSFDFRHIIKTLSLTHRCIAPDHIGFGLSAKPAVYNYTTQKHGERLEVLIDRLQLTNLTLVVHDFGGPIGFYLATKRPELIKNVVLMNTWMWSSRNEPEFKKLERILRSPLLPFLYRRFNFSARFVLPASFGRNKLSKNLRSQYTSPFADSSQREGTLAFARSLLADQDWFEQLWQTRHSLSDKPALLLWGMKDKIITPKYLDKLASAFTKRTVVKLPDAGHFPQEEEPVLVTEAIVSFLQQA